MIDKDRDAIEKAAGFDRTIAEDAIQKAMMRAMSESPASFESVNPGVLAFERVTPSGRNSNYSWQEIASAVSIETGFGILVVANCDWSFDDQPDEEAVYWAFDIPGLPDDYRTSFRNMIYPVDPETAPKPEDFAAQKKAVKLIEARVRELDGRADQIELSGGDVASIRWDIGCLQTLQNEITPDDKEIVAEVLKLEFDSAVEKFNTACLEVSAPAV